MVLEGLSVDVERDLTLHALFLVEVDSGFYTADLVSDSDREDRSDGVERDFCFVKLGLVEGDFDGLGLGVVLDDQLVPYPFLEELKPVRSDQASTCLGLWLSGEEDKIV